ncbi:MAG: hypothetical protein ACXQS5_02380 [Candidatus Methanospirareceae archaeon]
MTDLRTEVEKEIEKLRERIDAEDLKPEERKLLYSMLEEMKNLATSLADVTEVVRKWTS